MLFHFHLYPEMHAMAKMAKMAKNRQPLRIWVGSKRAPLETGDFGENRQRAGDNGEKPPGPLATGDSGEISDFAENRQRAGYDGEKRPGPSETGDLGENGDFGKNRHRASLPRRRF